MGELRLGGLLLSSVPLFRKTDTLFLQYNTILKFCLMQSGVRVILSPFGASDRMLLLCLSLRPAETSVRFWTLSQAAYRPVYPPQASLIALPMLTYFQNETVIYQSIRLYVSSIHQYEWLGWLLVVEADTQQGRAILIKPMMPCVKRITLRLHQHHWWKQYQFQVLILWPSLKQNLTLQRNTFKWILQAQKILIWGYVCSWMGRDALDDKWVKSLPVTYALFSGTIGTQSVLFCKTLSTLLRTTLAGDSQLQSYFFWMTFLSFVATAYFWITRLNQVLLNIPYIIVLHVLRVRWLRLTSAYCCLTA